MYNVTSTTLNDCQSILAFIKHLTPKTKTLLKSAIHIKWTINAPCSIHDDDGSIWRRVHFNYLLYFNAKKKQTAVLLLLETWQTPLTRRGTRWHDSRQWFARSVVVLQLSINRDVLNADTTSRRYGSWFQVKNNTVLLLLQFPQQYSANYYWDFISKSIEVPQNATKFERHIRILGLDVHTPLDYIATCYFKCSLSAHRFDLIAKAVLDSFRPGKFHAINVICTWASTIPLAFHWHKFSR